MFINSLIFYKNRFNLSQCQFLTSKFNKIDNFHEKLNLNIYSKLILLYLILQKSYNSDLH